MDRRAIRVMAHVGVAVALSAVLQYLKIFQMPQGGSISLQTVPIIIMALVHGPKVGMLAGGLFGVLQLILDAYVVHPIQFLLDYPLAFMAIGLAGLWTNKKTVSIGLAYTLRLVAHVLSGVVFFAEYTPQGTNVWLYSLVYNGSYLLPEAILAGAVSVWLWRRLIKSGFTSLGQ